MSNKVEPSLPGKPWEGWGLKKAHFIAAALVVAAIVAGCGRESGSAKGGKQGKGPGGSNAPVAAIIGTVTQKDVPIYLDGLGTVQAFNTVTVRSRVDG